MYVSPPNKTPVEYVFLKVVAYAPGVLFDEALLGTVISLFDIGLLSFTMYEHGKEICLI